MMWRRIVNLYLSHNSVIGWFWGASGFCPGELISIPLHICTIVETWRNVHYLASTTLRFSRFCVIFSGICHFPSHNFVIPRPSIEYWFNYPTFFLSPFSRLWRICVVFRQEDKFKYWTTAASIDFSYESRTSAHTLVMYRPCKQIYRTNIHYNLFHN